MMSRGRVSQDYKLRSLNNHYGYGFYSFPFVGPVWKFPGLHLLFFFLLNMFCFALDLILLLYVAVMTK